MRRDELVRQLRGMSRMRSRIKMLEADLDSLRQQLGVLEAALDCLPEDEREIIDKMMVNPTRGAVSKICEMFCIEQASVYRRRNKGLKKLENFLSEMR